MTSTFRGLTPQDLHAHLHFFVFSERRPSRGEILMGSPPIEIPVLRQSFKRVPDRLSLLIRSGSIGRDAIDLMFKALRAQGRDFKARRSARLKLVSQLTPFWPIDDPTYPAGVVATLRTLCDILAIDWPPGISFVHPGLHVRAELPGTQDRDIAWEAGHAMGKVLGRILGGR